jgi:hypothetical protein
MSQSGFDDYSLKESSQAPQKHDNAASKRAAFKNTTKNKRRSKNDVQGRDYKCEACDKRYLSYPALYTHKKQKHQSGSQASKKITKQNSTVSNNRRGRPPKVNDKIDVRSDKYFDTNEKKAGDDKADYLTHYRECLDEFKRSKISLDNKIFVAQLQSDINPLLRKMYELYNESPDTLDLKSKVKTTDYAFAYYLYHVCERVNPDAYKDI